MKTTRVGFTALCALAAAGSVTAVAATYEAWGHTFTYNDFQPVTVEMTVATEKSTGHKMNLVKLKNGHMMALVPADRYMALMSIPSDDMVEGDYGIK